MNVKIALVQMTGFFEKDQSIDKMEAKVREAANMGADIVVLPEMWNCPYGTRFFKEYGEDEKGPSVLRMSKVAKEMGIYLFGGSVSELEDETNKVYNTCYVFNPQGVIIGKHRKRHLFDVNIKGKRAFRESDVLSPGDKSTVVDTEFGKIGVAICFDVRFAGDFDKMTKEMGAKMYIIPAAFNMTTGPKFWNKLMVGRAIDNQSFIVACAPALDENAPYDAYGHSLFVNPWGDIVSQLKTEEAILFEELDLDMVNDMRSQIPILNPMVD